MSEATKDILGILMVIIGVIADLIGLLILKR